MLKYSPQARWAVAHVSPAGNELSFKTYYRLGDAKSAVSQSRQLFGSTHKVLERVDDEWYTLYTAGHGELPWVREVLRNNFYSGRYTTLAAVPMTREEYAEWRLAVEAERRG